MKEPKFTYTFESGNEDGFVSMFSGVYSNEKEGILSFSNENDLAKALKDCKKKVLIAWDNDSLILKKGEEIAKKLNLEFVHA